MNALMNLNEMFTASFEYFEITLSAEVAKLCSRSGDCDDDVTRCLALPEVAAELKKLDKNNLLKELKEYGAWDDSELNNHDENLKRILWITAGNIREENNF